MNKIDFIANLPVEVSLDILSYLPKRDLATCAQVSEIWKRVCLHPSLCQNLEKKKTKELKEFHIRRMTRALNWTESHIEAYKGGIPKDPNAVDKNDQTPLHIAAKKGHIQTVRILLDRGAKPNLRDKKGNTALQLAIDAGQVDVVRFLLQQIFI